MNQILTKEEIKILTKKVETILKKDKLKTEVIKNELLFKSGNFIVAYFNIDEIKFEGCKFQIIGNDKNSFYKSYWFKKIKKMFDDYISSFDNLNKEEFSNKPKYLFQIECLNYFNFISSFPINYLNLEQQKIKNKILNNEYKCPYCGCRSVSFSNDFFECLICQGKISYKHQFSFCKMNSLLLKNIYTWDCYLENIITQDLNFYLFFNAICLLEQYGYNLDIDMFCDSMRKYDKKGFDCVDDDGNVHTYFWCLSETNFLKLRKNNNIKKYWSNRLEDLTKLNQNIKNKFPNLKYSVILLDKPNTIFSINSILDKNDYKKILFLMRNEMYLSFAHCSKFAKFKNLEKIEMFNNFSLSHYLLGLRESPYKLIRFLLGRTDLFLHTFNNQIKEFSFNGPKHGLMEMLLNEIDEIVSLNKIDMFMQTYEYSIMGTYLFKKSFVAQEGILTLKKYFDKNISKINDIKIKINQKIFNKTS